MSIPLRPFLRHPKILPDEFLLSFLIRVAAANHYDSMTTFISVIHMYSAVFGERDAIDNPVHFETYMVLAKLCGVSEIELFQHTVNRFANILVPYSGQQETITFRNDETLPTVDHEVYRRNCRSTSDAVFCPHCLKEAAYYRLSWHLNATTVCLKHHCLLVYNCQQCGAELTIQNIINYRCPKCQYDLTNSETICVSQDHLSVAAQSILHGWMGIIASVDIIPGISATTLYRVFTELKYCIHLKYDVNLTHPFPKCEVDAQGKSRTKGWASKNKSLHQVNVAAIKTLIDFPNGFYEFLDSYRETDEAPSISIGLGTLYWEWIDKEWLTPEYDFIQQAFNEYLVTRVDTLNPHIIKSRRLQKYPELKKRFQYIPTATASEDLSIYLGAILKMVKAGKIRAKPKIHGQGFKWVLQEDVVSLLPKLRNTVNFATTMDMLGVGRHITFSLLKRGLLEAVRGRTEDDSSEWAITIDSIADLKNRIKQSAAVLSTENISYVKKFSIVMQSALACGVGVVDILDRVLEGRIKGYLEDGSDGKISSLYLPVDTSRIIRKEVEDHYKLISLAKFCKKMEVKQVVVSKWVKSGLIKRAKRISNSDYFSQDGIDEFTKSYVTSKEAAELLSVGTLVVQKWARDGRLKPVSGSEIDGCHEYRFLRSEIESMKIGSRLTAPQMAKVLGISRSQICARIRQGKIKPFSGPGIDGSKHYLFLQIPENNWVEFR